MAWDYGKSSAEGMGGFGGTASDKPRSSLITNIARCLEAERPAWFAWVPVSIGLGIGLYFAISTEPSLLLVAAMLAGSLALRVTAARGLLTTVVTGIALLATIGFAAAKLRSEWVRAPVLERPTGLVDVRGFVELVEPKAKRGERLTLRTISIGRLPPEKTPLRVRIRVINTLPGLTPGQAIILKARLAPPAAPALPGGFDFARLAWFSGLGGVGYALARPRQIDSAGPPPWSLELRAAIERVRQAIAERVRARLPDQTGAIAVALITGERGGISEETNDRYRAAGLYHILSISGMHMAIMAGAVFVIARFLFAASAQIALRYPIKKWAAIVAAVAALAYLTLSGGAFATVRSYIMISVMFLAVLLDRPAVALRNVALAALIILLLFPESILDPGFQMSFAAVVSLVSVYEAIRRRRGVKAFSEYGVLTKVFLFFSGIILSTIVAGVAVAPIAAYHFHTTQHYAILANLVAMPASNLIVMPAALGALVFMPLGLEAPALWIMGLGIDVMTATARWVGTLPGAVGRVPAMPDYAFFLMVFGGLWLTLWQTRWRAFGVAVAAAGLMLAPGGGRPDVLIGGDGEDVAVRDAGGRLATLPGKRLSFEANRWLEHDGQTPAEDTLRSETFRCDAVGCTARVKGVALAVSRHPASFADDCSSAAILVMNVPRPKGCRTPVAMVDFFDVRYHGTHAIYLASPGHARIETVAANRGQRPWTAALAGDRRKPRARPAIPKTSAPAKARATPEHEPDTGVIGAPQTFTGQDRRPRPQDVDEDFEN